MFILAGQSNMEGHGQLRSLAHLGDHPQHGALLAKLRDDAGAWAIRDDVTIVWQAKAKGSGPLSVGCEDNQLPTKELTDEFVSQGGHWYCHYNGSAANYALIGYALAMALEP